MISNIPLLEADDFIKFTTREVVEGLGVEKIWVSKTGRSFLLESPDGVRKVNISKALQAENHDSDSLIQMFPHLEVAETELEKGETVWTAYVAGDGTPQERVDVATLFATPVADGKTV